jgi:hypothetical protein
MRNEHPLGSSGGSRGVEGVGDILRRARRRQIAVRKRRQLWLQRVDLEDSCAGRGNSVRRRSRREHHGRGAIGQHVAEPVIRVLGIERDKARAGLEHGKNPHHQLERTVSTDADVRARSDTECSQVPRQSIRARVQVDVRDLCAAELECGRPR